MMMKPRSGPALTVTLAALALGSLAVFLTAGEPLSPACRAREEARAKPVPGFVLLAGEADPACPAR